MLQIASGKLFTGKPAFSNKLRGILHTNLELFGSDALETGARRLLPINCLGPRKNLVYEMTEFMELAPAPGVVMSHGIDSYLNDFAAIVSFALNVTCTPDAELTSRLTNGRLGPSGNLPPARLITRVFDSQISCQKKDADQLVKTVSDLIGLKRKSYLAVMRAIRTYVTGLHRLADDYALAYTLLVASMESLAQGSKSQDDKWEDYESSRRNRIDCALVNADEATSCRVRKAILKNEHVSARRHFHNFTLSHLQPSYFREEAAGLDNPVGRAELDTALQQAYMTRSKYIHKLQELPAQLTLGASYRETSCVDRVTWFSFQGLARVVRHVIKEFIVQQPKVEKEEYAYGGERVGIVEMPVAPHHWINRDDNLTSSSGRLRFDGFLSQMLPILQQEHDVNFTDLEKMLEKAVRLLPNMNDAQRRPFVALYVIYNRVVLHDRPMKNFAKIHKQYGNVLEDPSIEALLVHLILRTVPDWTLEKHKKVHDKFYRDRGKSNSYQISAFLAAGLTLELAERYRLKGDAKRVHELIRVAVENCPGHVKLSQMEHSFEIGKEIDWSYVVLGVHQNPAI